MRFFVANNVRYMGKRFTASSTHVRFLFAMSSFVNQEIMGFVKLFVTLFTIESTDQLVVSFNVFLAQK